MDSKLAAYASDTPGTFMVPLGTIQAKSCYHQDAGKPEMVLEILTLLVNQTELSRSD